MKNKLQRFKKLFLRTKKMNATTARQAMPRTYEDEDDGSTRLSGAFIVVLLLHIVAVVGVIAFTRIKENRKAATPAIVAGENPTTGDPSASLVAGSAASTDVKPAPAKSAPPAEESARASFLANKSDTKLEAKRPEPAPSPTRVTGTPAFYLVKAGDNPARIAKDLGVDYDDLRKLNNIKDPKKLQPGQKLKVPPKKNG